MYRSEHSHVYFSSTIVPKFILIICPSISILVNLIVILFYSNDIFYFIIIFYYLVAVFIVSLLYGLFPIRHRSKYPVEKDYEKTERDHEKTGSDHEKTVIEFEFIKKILWIGLPIVFSIEILFFLFYNNFLNYGFVVTLEAFNISLLFGGVIRILSYISKRHFRFYFAKGCCKIATKKEYDFEKLKYLFLALGSYDKYLQRTIGFQINNIEKIQSMFISSTVTKNNLIKDLCNSLNFNASKLAEYLSINYGLSKADLFVRESPLQKLKTIGAFFATAIPIIISLIQIIFGVGG